MHNSRLFAKDPPARYSNADSSLEAPVGRHVACDAPRMAELTSKKKDRDVATTSTAPPAASQSRHSGLLSWVANLVVLSLYRAITTVGSPVGGLIAFYLWCGRGTFNLIRVLQRSLLRGVGWLSGPAFAPDNWIRIWAKYHVNLDIKRWHLSVGEHCHACSLPVTFAGTAAFFAACNAQAGRGAASPACQGCQPSRDIGLRTATIVDPPATCARIIARDGATGHIP